MGREGRNAEKVVHRLGVEGKPPLAGEQRSGGVRSSARLAQRRTPGRARAAAAAARDEHQHDMIAGFEVGHALAHVLDDRRCLVAERHRDGPWPRAVDHRQVRMAQARRCDLDQEFAAAGGAKVELGDFERLRVGVGRLKARLAKNGGLDAHGDHGSRNQKRRCWARSPGGATGKLTRDGATCAPRAPAPHTD